MRLKRAAGAALVLLTTALLVRSQEINSEVVRLNKIAGERLEAHDWDAAERDYLHALEIAGKTEAKRTIATLHQNLGTVYATAHRYSDAQGQYRLAYELFKAEYGDKHPKVALALNSIAEMMCFQGQIALARPVFERSLSIVNSQSSNDPEFASVMINLASVEWFLGNLTKAEKMLRRLTPLLETAGKDWQPKLAVALQIRARIAEQMGDFAGAEISALSALSILEQSHNPEDLAGGLTMVAQQLLRKGDLQQAQARLERAQQVLRAAAAEGSPINGALMCTLAKCYHKQGRARDADSSFQRSIGVYQRTLGPDHPSLLYAMQDYAEFLRTTKRKKDAKRLEAYVHHHQSQGASLTSAQNVVDFRQLLQEQRH